MKLNHLTLIVRDVVRSRDWYVNTLGMRLDFEVQENGFVALEEDTGFGFLLAQGSPVPGAGDSFNISLEVEDVDELYARLSRAGVVFDHPPRQEVWGYGPQLRDPDGYVLRFFDHRSITEREGHE